MKSIKNLKSVMPVLLVLTILLAGCSSDVVEADSIETTVKIQIIGGATMEDKTDVATGQKLIGLHYIKDLFEEKHPGVKVEFVIMGWDNYVQKTQAMIESNECDVYQVPAIASLAAQGLLDPLGPYIDKDNFDLEQFINGQVDGWKAMGPDDSELNIYGIPFLGDTRLIVYDKLIFDQWGVEYLSEEPTLEEIEEKAKLMTGLNPVTGEMNYGITFKAKDAADSMVNIAEYKGGTWGEGFRWNEMTTRFDSSEMVEATAYMVNLLQYAPEGLMAGQGSEHWLTETNNIAINLREAPQYQRNTIALGLEDRYQGALLFVNEEKGMGGMFAGSPFAIGATSENKDLAWEFIKFSASDDVQQYLFLNMENVPVTKSSYNWDSVKSNPQMEVILDSMGRLWTPRYPYRASQPRFILSENVEKALLGEVSPKEAMDKAQSDIIEWIGQQQ